MMFDGSFLPVMNRANDGAWHFFTDNDGSFFPWDGRLFPRDGSFFPWDGSFLPPN